MQRRPATRKSTANTGLEAQAGSSPLVFDKQPKMTSAMVHRYILLHQIVFAWPRGVAEGTDWQPVPRVEHRLVRQDMHLTLDLGKVVLRCSEPVIVGCRFAGHRVVDDAEGQSLSAFARSAPYADLFFRLPEPSHRCATEARHSICSLLALATYRAAARSWSLTGTAEVEGQPFIAESEALDPLSGRPAKYHLWLTQAANADLCSISSCGRIEIEKSRGRFGPSLLDLGARGRTGAE
jgi:hypothetical protein